MIWKLLLGLLAFVNPSERSEPASGWEAASNVGPQSSEDADRAQEALHGLHNGGDILEDERRSGDGIKDIKYRWFGYPGKGIVPYVINQNLNSIKPLITKAMKQYHTRTCIQFVPKNKTHTDWIELTKGTGCNSNVGRQGIGRQIVNLGDGCQYVGTIVHELGHAIGLHHEHQRSDRDKSINVFMINIKAGYAFNFNKTSPNDELILTTYDYSSIMHYGNYAFSKQPGRKMTMEAKNGQRLLEPYDKAGFTNADVTTIKKLYKC